MAAFRFGRAQMRAAPTAVKLGDVLVTNQATDSQTPLAGLTVGVGAKCTNV